MLVAKTVCWSEHWQQYLECCAEDAAVCLLPACCFFWRRTNCQVPSLSDAYQTTAPLHLLQRAQDGSAMSSLNLTVLVDGGLLESYANARVVLSSLLSPSVAGNGTNGTGSSEPEDRQVRTFATLQAGRPVCSGDAWRLKSVPH